MKKVRTLKDAAAPLARLIHTHSFDFQAIEGVLVYGSFISGRRYNPEDGSRSAEQVEPQDIDMVIIYDDSSPHLRELEEFHGFNPYAAEEGIREVAHADQPPGE